MEKDAILRSMDDDGLAEADPTPSPSFQTRVAATGFPLPSSPARNAWIRAFLASMRPASVRVNCMVPDGVDVEG
jgi:hypothetical protein